MVHTKLATIPKEDYEQKKLYQWCLAKKLLCYATPNGGTRNKREAINLKLQGVTSGVSDFTVMLPHKILFIELKRQKRQLKNGKWSVSHTPTSDKQIEFIDKVNALSYASARVCHGAKEAINYIKENLR